MSNTENASRVFDVVESNIFLDFGCYLCKFNTFPSISKFGSFIYPFDIMIGYVVGHVEQLRKEFRWIINDI